MQVTQPFLRAVGVPSVTHCPPNRVADGRNAKQRALVWRLQDNSSVSPHSSVSMTADYGPDGRWFDSRQGQDFYLLYSVQTG
jgi:hypothetical protein